MTGKEYVLMHILIYGHKNVDHKNRDRLDNRKTNLRKSTALQNARNRGLQSNNTSGVTGVYFRNERNAWFSQITVDGKTKTVKYSHDKEEAIKARLEAEAKYFGEFAPQRDLFEKYDIKMEV